MLFRLSQTHLQTIYKIMRIPTKSHYSIPRRQQGLVMLMVVGIVVMMITLLAVLLEDQHLLIRQIGNQRVSEQGHHYSQGLTAWALRVLHEDDNRRIDHEQEEWAKFGRPEPEIEEGEEGSFSLDSSISPDEDEESERPTIDFGIDTLEVTIEDLQGRFNLNNLVAAKKDDPPPQDQRRIFLNLLQILEIGEFQEDRNELYWNLLDWLDENDTSAGVGAESGDYQVRSTPYFASDQPLSNIGELKYVKGYSKKVIRKLLPFVTVLPVQRASLNLNTVKPEVLASLAGGAVADASQVDAFLSRKQEPGFQGFQASEIQNAQSTINLVSPGSNSIPNMLQVNSQFFQINTKVELGDRQVCTRTIVLRNSDDRDNLRDQTISVLSREQDTVCAEEQANNSVGEDEVSSDEDIR